MRRVSLPMLLAGLMAIPAASYANDFSTVTRVHYVQECIDSNPKMNLYEATYKCSCVVDKLAEEFTQKEFEEADTGFQMRNFPADRGAMFRDDADVVDGIGRFNHVHAQAYVDCKIKR
jgi:hypothetical protein